jgi:hypothetical protein
MQHQCSQRSTCRRLWRGYKSPRRSTQFLDEHFERKKSLGMRSEQRERMRVNQRAGQERRLTFQMDRFSLSSSWRKYLPRLRRGRQLSHSHRSMYTVEYRDHKSLDPRTPPFVLLQGQINKKGSLSSSLTAHVFGSAREGILIQWRLSLRWPPLVSSELCSSKKAISGTSCGWPGQRNNC